MSHQKPTNKEFTKDSNFIQACSSAGIPPTKRQASKFRRKKGLAWTSSKGGSK